MADAVTAASNGEATSWQSRVIRGAIVLLLVLLFQQLSRGSVDPLVAGVVAVGYVLVAEVVRRWG